MLNHQLILHPTDFSAASDLACQLASSLARDHNARLVVVHVMPPPALAYGVDVMPAPIEIDRSHLTDRLREMQQRQSKVPIETILIEGDPEVEILRLADELPCDLIVMGTHGRTGWSRLLMGSIAEQIVRKASCPVLTVKRPMDGEHPKENEEVKKQEALAS